jgi:ubiquinone/menaquinone biosynthesis C-methylase UbiE
MFQHATDYRTNDIAHDLDPDTVGSIENISFRDNSFDLLCAFQVLEHLPFSLFESCLKELSRVSSNDVLISLPYQRRQIFVMELKVPYVRTKRISINMPVFYRDFSFDGEHYWEIGARGYSQKKIKWIISKYFTITKVLHPYENKFHIFFVLEKL